MVVPLSLSQPPATSHQLPFYGLVNRAPAAADRGADERALLATEDSADARAGRRRSADDERGFLPVMSRRALDACNRPPRRRRALRRTDRTRGAHRLDRPCRERPP